MTTELLVLMGSGETTPTMIKSHRAVFQRVGDRPAVLLDTPYGFQANADDISARAVSYFSASVGRHVEVVGWRRRDLDTVAREQAIAGIRGAGWVFAGPGSPTYTLRQWRDTPIPALLREAPVLVFASAAALTLGSHTIPVYEIYKAGEEPRWEPGLDLFQQLTGVPAVIIPHYDNAEGGHHDTRYCYLGEPRLIAMEQLLPPETLIIGVDEHTGAVIDLVTRSVTAVGNGVLTIRHQGHSRVYPSGATFDLDELTGTPRRHDTATRPAVVVAPAAASEPPGVRSVREAADRAEAAFQEARDARDIDGCVAQILHLAEAIEAWAADTQVSPDADHAQAVLRGMVVGLGRLAANALAGVTPLVEAVLELRRQARAARDFDAADTLREALSTAGVEVRDGTPGTAWTLRQPA